GRRRAEGLLPARVAGRERQAGEPVEAARRRDDPLAAREAAREAERDVHRLAPGRREDGEGEGAAGARGELLAESGAPAAHQVVVADVEVLERLAQRRERPRVAVAEVED